jgi:hypothetical protein
MYLVHRQMNAVLYTQRCMYRRLLLRREVSELIARFGPRGMGERA